MTSPLCVNFLHFMQLESSFAEFLLGGMKSDLASLWWGYHGTAASGAPYSVPC